MSTPHQVNLAEVSKVLQKSLPTKGNVCAFYNLNTDWEVLHLGESPLAICPADQGKHRPHTYVERCLKKPPAPALAPPVKVTPEQVPAETRRITYASRTRLTPRRNHRLKRRTNLRFRVARNWFIERFMTSLQTRQSCSSCI